MFDPRGIVSETLDNNLQVHSLDASPPTALGLTLFWLCLWVQYMLPSSQSYEEYIALDPPHWKERVRTQHTKHTHT